MKLDFSDYNDFDNLLISNANHKYTWTELESCLQSMPLHLKQSDQRGKQGEPIFDPVGTNEYIKSHMSKVKDWKPNFPIPSKYRHLGTDVDFVKMGILVEVQFSNYPFLTNNLLRSELFYKSHSNPFDQQVEGLIIVTKSGKYPSSNSTLYYEQAKKLIDSLSSDEVFSIPIRLVCLDILTGINDINWTKYSANRYSRNVLSRDLLQCKVSVIGNKKAVIEVLKN